MKHFFKYMLEEFFCFVLYFPFPTHHLYIILCHPEIFLAVSLPFGVTNIPYTSLSLTTLTLSVIIQGYSKKNWTYLESYYSVTQHHMNIQYAPNFRTSIVFSPGFGI